MVGGGAKTSTKPSQTKMRHTRVSESNKGKNGKKRKKTSTHRTGVVHVKQGSNKQLLLTDEQKKQSEEEEVSSSLPEHDINHSPWRPVTFFH